MFEMKESQTIEEKFLRHFPPGTIIDDRTKDRLKWKPETIEMPEDVTSPPFIKRPNPDSPEEKFLSAIFGKQ